MKNMFNKPDFDPEELYKKLLSYKNHSLDYTDQKQIFQSTPTQTAQVKLRPNKNVAPALFKPDPLIPGGWIAHPVTISAVKADIFMGGDDFIDLEALYTCESCNKELDIQFWNFCPYCEKSFPTNLVQENNRIQRD
jgi:hypothetical protein